MPKQLTFHGRYNLEGNPEGFAKDMRQQIAEQFAGQEVDFVIIAREPKPSPSLRGFFMASVLPWFMEVMMIEEGWELHPANKHDCKVARVRILETFHRGISVTQDDDGKQLIKLPSFADLSKEDYLYLIERLELHCAENYGRSMPSAEEYKKQHPSKYRKYSARY